LVYADDVNILGGSVHNIKKITDALVVPGKEMGLKVNSDETKYLVMSRDQNAERCRVEVTATGRFFVQRNPTECVCVCVCVPVCVYH
jgi:hypothetical protein